MDHAPEKLPFHKVSEQSAMRHRRGSSFADWFPRQLHHFRCLQARFGILVASRRAREISPTQWRAITRDSVAGKLISMQVISPRRRQNGAACREETSACPLRRIVRAPRHRDSNTVWHCLNSVWEHVFNVFFQISKMWLFMFFWNTCQKVVKSRYQKFSPQSFEISSRTSLCDHCNSFQLFICQSSVFEDLQTFIAHSSNLHSFLWIWTLRPHFWARCLMSVTYRYWLSVIGWLGDRSDWVASGTVGYLRF